MSAARVEHLPSGVRTASDYQQIARQRLDEIPWHYLQEGSGEGLSMAANRNALDRISLMSRPLADVRSGHTRLQLFGQTLEHPLLLAPIAYQRLFHSDGECASAMAAAAQGGNLLVSSLASMPLEQIASASQQTGGQPPWFQLYWQGERQRTLRLAQRAIAAGYPVIVFTVDAPVKLASLTLPGDIRAVNLEQPLAAGPVLPGQSQVFDGWMAQAPNWDDLAWLRQQIKLPLLLKGILHADDAERAIQIGCDGLLISNHGGRVLDGVPAAIDCLPAIVERVAGRIPLLFDSGIRNGRDVYKALQLGASAVLIGRPAIWGLASAGALGVAHVIRLLRDELEVTMALCGSKTLADIPAKI